MGSEIPEPVRRFLASNIDSVSLLDVLLLVRAAPDKSWTAQETARALVSGEAIAQVHLERLAGEGLVMLTPDGFRYDPGARGEVVESLADCYAKRRHTVIALIYGSDARQATTLSDAFKLRRRRD